MVEQSGNDTRFHELSALGTLAGQKRVAEAFEAVVEKFLVKHEVDFQAEAEVKAQWQAENEQQARESGERHVRQGRAPFKPTGELDRQGRKLYTGPCAACGNECVVPFRPNGKSNPPKCGGGRKALLTPDFLIPGGGLVINGQRCFWLECKCMYGGEVTTRSTNIQAQVEKYRERWGPGALVFALGFCEGVRFEGAMVLGASPLELAPLKDALAVDMNPQQLAAWLGEEGYV